MNSNHHGHGLLCAVRSAIYYAPRNTFDVSNPDLGSDFSTENQVAAETPTDIHTVSISRSLPLSAALCLYGTGGDGMIDDYR